MITNLTYEEMEEHLDQGCVCGECGAQLAIAWGGAWGYESYVLRCFKNVHHSTVTKTT